MCKGVKGVKNYDNNVIELFEERRLTQLYNDEGKYTSKMLYDDYDGIRITSITSKPPGIAAARAYRRRISSAR